MIWVYFVAAVAVLLLICCLVLLYLFCRRKPVVPEPERRERDGEEWTEPPMLEPFYRWPPVAPDEPTPQPVPIVPIKPYDPWSLKVPSPDEPLPDKPPPPPPVVPPAAPPVAPPYVPPPPPVEQVLGLLKCVVGCLCTHSSAVDADYRRKVPCLGPMGAAYARSAACACACSCACAYAKRGLLLGLHMHAHHLVCAALTRPRAVPCMCTHRARTHARTVHHAHTMHTPCTHHAHTMHHACMAGQVLEALLARPELLAAPCRAEPQQLRALAEAIATATPVVLGVSTRDLRDLRVDEQRQPRRL